MHCPNKKDLDRCGFPGRWCWLLWRCSFMPGFLWGERVMFHVCPIGLVWILGLPPIICMAMVMDLTLLLPVSLCVNPGCLCRMITERVSWVGHVHLVQCNLDIKFCDIDSKSELWCIYICAGVGLSEQPTMNKTFPFQSVLLKSKISSGEMSPALRKPLYLTLSILVGTTGFKHVSPFNTL